MTNQIEALIRECGHDDALIAAGIENLAQVHGATGYQQALKLLCGKHYEPATARNHWEKAMAHRNRLFAGEQPFMGFRAALLDYLFNIAGELRDPRIVEADQLEHIRQASITDGLTGLYHQTYFKAHLEKLINDQKSSRSGEFAVVMLDLDHFKQYNDRCGHLAGDQALKAASAIIQKELRQGDLACRYGGEEFTLLLHGVNAQKAFALVESIRVAIEEADFPGQALLDRSNLTVSGGIALYPNDADNASELLAVADQELYRAKEQRNAVCPSQHGQRRESRLPLQSLVEFSFENGETFHTGMSLDISSTGVGLACSLDKLSPGTPLLLRFRQPFWPTDCQLKASVRNIIVTDKSGLVRLGLEFSEKSHITRALLPGRGPVPFHRTDIEGLQVSAAS